MPPLAAEGLSALAQYFSALPGASSLNVSLSRRRLATAQAIEEGLDHCMLKDKIDPSVFIPLLQDRFLVPLKPLLYRAKLLEILSLDPEDPTDMDNIQVAQPWHIHPDARYKIMIEGGFPLEVAVGSFDFDPGRYSKELLEDGDALDRAFSAHIEERLASGAMRFVSVPFLTCAELTQTTVHRRGFVPADFPKGQKRFSARFEVPCR